MVTYGLQDRKIEFRFVFDDVEGDRRKFARSEWKTKRDWKCERSKKKTCTIQSLFLDELSLVLLDRKKSKNKRGISAIAYNE